VLHAGDGARAVIAAIVEAYPDAEIVDRGAYLRVLVPRRCVVTREAIERHRGGRFVLPSDLEQIMSSFQGRISLGDDEVRWEAAR
jgi:hypothetical protein